MLLGRASGAYLTVDQPYPVVFIWGIPGSDALPPGGSTAEVVLTEPWCGCRSPAGVGGAAPIRTTARVAKVLRQRLGGRVSLARTPLTRPERASHHHLTAAGHTDEASTMA